MEQLDLVYNTFANLERNYGRSKKSRSEYVKDKFGGDIAIGSFLILNALSAEEFTDPEDVRKFTEIRDIFEYLNTYSEKLDSLPSFNVQENDILTEVTNALNAAQFMGSAITTCNQRELFDMERGTLHYSVQGKVTRVAPLDTVKYCKLFNGAMLEMLAPHCKGNVQLNDVIERENLGNVFVKTNKLKL